MNILWNNNFNIIRMWDLRLPFSYYFHGYFTSLTSSYQKVFSPWKNLHHSFCHPRACEASDYHFPIIFTTTSLPSQALTKKPFPLRKTFTTVFAIQKFATQAVFQFFMKAYLLSEPYSSLKILTFITSVFLPQNGMIHLFFCFDL